VNHLKKVHEDTRHTIERKVQRLATKLNINKQPMVFNIGDLVWLHLRKERFPQEHKSKLRPRADGPFKVLARYNDNAYKIDIPRDKYNVSDIFNIKDLSPFHGDEELDPRTDLPQGRGDDAEHPTTIPMDATSTIQAPSGPMTRARARAIQSEVTSLLLEFSPSLSETWLLPKSEILCVNRYNAQDSEPRTVEEETGVNTLDSPEPPARARNFRPPDPPADPELPASDVFDQPRRANSLVSPEPVLDLPAPGTSGLPGPSSPRTLAQLPPCQLSS